MAVHLSGRARAGRSAAHLGSAQHLLTHRAVLFRVTKNEVAVRYAGSFLGWTWVFLAPLLLLAVYAVVYLEIFSLQLPNLDRNEYVVYIFAGLVPYLVTAEAITGGLVAVVANRALLNNTVFPIDLAPVKPVLASLGTMTVGMGVVVAGTAATGNLGWPILFLPFVMVTHVMTLIGVVWILSLLNVVLRDLQSIITVVLMVLLIASPIAYAPQMVPAKLKFFLALNPLSYFIFGYQKATVLERYPSPYLVVGLLVMAVAAFAAGSWFFSRAKRVIVDYV